MKKGDMAFLPARSDILGALKALGIWAGMPSSGDSAGAGISPALPGHFGWIWEADSVIRMNPGH